jgi:hypothetical protein
MDSKLKTGNIEIHGGSLNLKLISYTLKLTASNLKLWTIQKCPGFSY